MGVIYLLTNDKNQGYIGKTITSINRRLSVHKSKGNKSNSRKLGDNFKCEILWEGDNDYLDDYEQYHYDLFKYMYGDLLVNKNRPLNTLKEYAQENKDKINERSKIYYQEHKDKDEFKEKEKIYTQNRNAVLKEKKQKYKDEHKDEINEKKQNRKNVKREKRNIKYDCECGGKYTYTNKSRHLTLKRHLKYYANKTN